MLLFFVKMSMFWIDKKMRLHCTVIEKNELVNVHTLLLQLQQIDNVFKHHPSCLEQCIEQSSEHIHKIVIDL